MATIPRKDKDFLAFGRNVYELTVSRASDWGYATKELQEFSALENDAESAYEANINPRTSSRTTSALKKTSFAAYEKFLRGFVKKLEANDKVTEAELLAMGLPSRVHHAHGKLPPPSEVLDLNVTTGKHLEVDVRARIPESGHPTEYLKHHGIAGIVIRFRVDGGEWQERYVKRTGERLSFSPEQEGLHVTVSAAWINPSLEPGPFCPEIRVLIN